jgi:hypothetical protein
MTKASTFVRSWLGFANSFYDGMFHDCYISIEPEKMIHIVLVEKKEDKQYEEISNKLKEHSWFSNLRPSDGFVIFDFDIPEDRIDDFDNFIKGKYSKLSSSAKELILMSHENMDNIKNLAVILYPEQKHRDQLAQLLNDDISPEAEVYDKPDITKELLPQIIT